MSSSTVWRPDCRLQASRLEQHQRRLVLALVLLSLCAGHPPRIWLCLALLTLVPAAFCYVRRPSGSLPLTRLRQSASGWRLHLVDGEEVYADLHGPVRDWGFAVFLAWREQAGETAGRRRIWRVVLWSDQLPADDWRRLRVSLIWRRHALPGSLAGRQRKPPAQDTRARAAA